jgi:hypothetical protein
MFTRIISKIPLLNLRKLNLQTKSQRNLLNKFDKEIENENCVIKFIEDFFIKKEKCYI